MIYTDNHNSPERRQEEIEKVKNCHHKILNCILQKLKDGNQNLFMTIKSPQKKSIENIKVTCGFVSFQSMYDITCTGYKTRESTLQ